VRPDWLALLKLDAEISLELGTWNF
jgi:hypothetical protein